MHALLIHQAFASPDEPGGTRHYELARETVRRGHRFTIVASDVSYMTGRPRARPRGLFSEEHLDGIRVFRAYAPPTLHRSFAWRVASFLVFMLSSVRAALAAGRIDVVMGTTPPIFQALSAWIVAGLRRRPFVLEVRDLWPAFAIDMGVLRSRALIRASYALESFLYGRAAHLIVNSPAYRDYLASRGVPPDRISLIPNGTDPGMFDPASRGESVRAAFGVQDRFVVTYAGALGRANDIPTLLRAAERLRDEPRIHVLLVGDGKERPTIERIVAERQLANVTLTGPKSKAEMREVLAASDACVAILQDIPMFRTTYPNKVFDYMAAGRPVVCAIDGVIRAVVEIAHAGVFVPPGDDAALAAAIRKLAADPGRAAEIGRAGRAHVERHFDRRVQAERFVGVLIATAPSQGGAYRRWGKRALDLAITLPAVAVLAPLMFLVAGVVRLHLGSPVVFRQPRLGQHCRPLTVLKFRTMTDRCCADGRVLPDEQRLTPFGRWLRATSLDELPELFNVLRGEMTLVGPRPLLVQYRDRYSREQLRRHEVKPGITGLAQVNGRNALTWERKFELDVWYVDHQSLALDLRILARTARIILARRGITQPGHVTAEEFTGSGS